MRFPRAAKAGSHAGRRTLVRFVDADTKASGVPVVAGFRADTTADNTGVRPRLLECLRESVHKGELARSANKSAPPTTTNVTGSRSFTDSGASSPSTTNVTTTHRAVGIAPPGDSTPHTTDKPLCRGAVEARLSDGVGLVPRQRTFYLTKDRHIRTGHGEIVLALTHGPWSVVRTYSPSMTARAQRPAFRPVSTSSTHGWLPR